jgi:hypothetical protein
MAKEFLNKLGLKHEGGPTTRLKNDWSYWYEDSGNSSTP